MKAMRIQTMRNVYFSGSTQNSWKKLMRPRISTGVQNTITVAIDIRMFAPHDAKYNCRLNINSEPMKQPMPIRKVTGWWSPKKFLS